MSYKFKDVPADVLKVWTIYHNNIAVGVKTLELINDIIDKNPKYFEWEHKYKNIPNKVHEAFSKECYPNKWIDFNEWQLATKGEVNCKKGIMEHIRDNPTEVTTLTKESLDTIIKDLFEARVIERDKEKAEHKRVKAIWNKHYKKYNLKYRE